MQIHCKISWLLRNKIDILSNSYAAEFKKNKKKESRQHNNHTAYYIVKTDNCLNITMTHLGQNVQGKKTSTVFLFGGYTIPNYDLNILLFRSRTVSIRSLPLSNNHGFCLNWML